LTFIGVISLFADVFNTIDQVLLLGPFVIASSSKGHRLDKNDALFSDQMLFDYRGMQ
jgi:hypothetical protein